MKRIIGEREASLTRAVNRWISYLRRYELTPGCKNLVVPYLVCPLLVEGGEAASEERCGHLTEWLCDRSEGSLEALRNGLLEAVRNQVYGKGVDNGNR